MSQVTPVISTLKRLRMINPLPGRLTGGSDYTAHSVRASFELGKTEPGSQPKPGQVRVEVKSSGEFRLELPDQANTEGGLTVETLSPAGQVLAVKSFPRLADLKAVEMEAKPQPPLPSPPPAPAGNPVGRLQIVFLDAGDRRRLTGIAGAQVLFRTKGRAGQELVFPGKTDAYGNMFLDRPTGPFAEASGEVAGGRQPVPVLLEADGSLPKKVVLLVEGLLARPASAVGCACVTNVPTNPAMSDLVEAPDTFATDKGGRCVDFTMPNRTIEEFHYTLIVRTTDPEIQGLTVEDAAPLPPAKVREISDLLDRLEKFRPVVVHDEPLNRLEAQAVVGPGPRPVVANPSSPQPAPPSVPVTPPATGGTGGSPPTVDASVSIAALANVLKNRRPLSPDTLAQAVHDTVREEINGIVRAARPRPPGRVKLDASHPLDWDDEPTFYQATTIAHGHLLRFRQLWKAAGYSLGDLVYSLPLAPCQKKQIAIVDWERRDTGTRDESLLATEQLNALLERDRDVQEIVKATLEEELKGQSFAGTFGLGGGAGKAGESEPGGSDFVLGVAGGIGLAGSAASQEGTRRLSASSLQRLRDRTLQSASAVRGQRATVVQSVGQNESVRVQTEVVANHNHCHAMTVEYFEVLRHFLVEHDLVDVQECLFVPLLMAAFDADKALRWREALGRRLRDRRLVEGFDALERVRNNFVGSDLPMGRYADERIETLEGELTVTFRLPRPADKPNGELDEPAVRGRLGRFVDFVSGIIDRLSFVTPGERDQVWDNEVVPQLAEQILVIQGLNVEVLGAGGASDARLDDATLVSRPRAGAPLRVSLRPRGAVRRIARADVRAVRLSLDDTVPPEAQLIVRSGILRYRTAHYQGVLFNERRLDNDLAVGDAVLIDTPLTAAELRHPREENRELALRLIDHLNEHLEHYHRAIWLGMDASRRYMLLDGILAPQGKGLSVASVVENRVLAVVGNCLVLPVAPGVHLDPTVKVSGPDGLFAHYRPASPASPARVSVPTRGVFAEAVLGACNSCEKIDETRFWRWEESPCPDEPTAISPVGAESRQAAPPNLTPTPLPASIINLQNAPAAPDPSGLTAALQILGQAGVFKDVTGLEGNQKNAAAALSQSLETAKAFGQMAATLALQDKLSRDGDKVLETIENAHASGAITDDQRREATTDFLKARTGSNIVREPVEMGIQAERIAAFTSELPTGASFDADFAAQRLSATGGTPAQSGPAGPGAVPTPSPNEEALRTALAAMLKADPALSEIISRSEVLTGKRDRVEYLARALLAAESNGLTEFLAPPRTIIKRLFPRNGISLNRQEQALFEAASILASHGTELSFDAAEDKRPFRNRFSFSFGAEPSTFDSFPNLPGAGELMVGTIALGPTIPKATTETHLSALPTGAFAALVKEQDIDATKFLDLVWSLAVAIRPQLDEDFGGPPAVSAPKNLYYQRIDLNRKTEIFTAFDLSLSITLPGGSATPRPPAGTDVVIGSIPTTNTPKPPPGTGTKITGRPLVAFIGSSTLFDSAAITGRFYASTIADILSAAKSSKPSFALTVSGLVAIDSLRETTGKKSDQGGIALGHFAGLARIDSANVAVIIFAGAVEAKVAQSSAAGRDRFAEMWRKGAGIEPEFLPPEISKATFIQAIHNRIDSLKEGQVLVLNYIGHTYRFFANNRVAGIGFFPDDQRLSPAEFEAISAYATSKRVHFLAVMETCQSGAYLNELASVQFNQLTADKKATGRLGQILRMLTALQDIFFALTRLEFNFSKITKDQHAEWTTDALAAATDADIGNLPVMDLSSATAEKLGAANSDRTLLLNAIKDIRKHRKTLGEAAEPLKAVLAEALNSPLINGFVPMPTDHGEEGKADELAGPVADSLTAAFQMEYQALLTS